MIWLAVLLISLGLRLVDGTIQHRTRQFSLMPCLAATLIRHENFFLSCPIGLFCFNFSHVFSMGYLCLANWNLGKILLFLLFTLFLIIFHKPILSCLVLSSPIISCPILSCLHTKCTLVVHFPVWCHFIMY